MVCNANFQSTSAGYAMLQWPCHTTLVVPMDADYGLWTFVQTAISGLLGGQPAMMLALFLGAVGAPISVPVQTGNGVLPFQTCADQVHMITFPTFGGVEGPLHVMSVPTVSKAALVQIDSGGVPIHAPTSLSQGGQTQRILTPPLGGIGGLPPH